ncbi:hypothetical protein RchiOBHm_Chr6g0246151 [Rosa chinensis]|uniref:Uncharacterized protein n=1 Tax=Rosa chinensis TaxID=74649 RepID=A0A2P6PJH2_ROSCH|nr:hypothetical protein RchiOBHm_Chr6g0246151 [Rosa chinensis]
MFQDLSSSVRDESKERRLSDFPTIFQIPAKPLRIWRNPKVIQLSKLPMTFPRRNSPSHPSLALWISVLPR